MIIYGHPGIPEHIVSPLPPDAQAIFAVALDRAMDQYAEASRRSKGESQKDAAFRVAWAAVWNEYELDLRSVWRRKSHR